MAFFYSDLPYFSLKTVAMLRKSVFPQLSAPPAKSCQASSPFAARSEALINLLTGRLPVPAALAWRVACQSTYICATRSCVSRH